MAPRQRPRIAQAAGNGPADLSLARLLKLAAIVTVTMLTSCASRPAKPHSALKLAARVRGCTRIRTQKPVRMEFKHVTCAFAGGDEPIAIAAFTSYGAERRWIPDCGSPDSPGPRYQGCCVQGNLWAATADFNQLKSRGRLLVRPRPGSSRVQRDHRCRRRAPGQQHGRVTLTRATCGTAATVKDQCHDRCRPSMTLGPASSANGTAPR